MKSPVSIAVGSRRASPSPRRPFARLLVLAPAALLLSGLSTVPAGPPARPAVAAAPAATPATTVVQPHSVVASGDWPQFHNDATHDGYNSAETTLSASDVAGLGVAWTGTTGSPITSSPAVSNGVVYVGSLDDKLYAYAVGCNKDGGSCAPLWTATTGGLVVSSPAVSNGVVYVGSYDDKLYAYAVGCGGSCTPVWTATTGGSINSSPAVTDGVVYVGSWDGKLYAYAVGCASGGDICTPLWTATTDGRIASSPVVSNGVVYVGSEDGRLYAYAVDCASGGGSCAPLWTATIDAPFSFGIASSPAVSNGVVYIGSYRGQLHAFAVGCASDGGSCTPLWSSAGIGRVVSSPAVANGIVYVGSRDGKLYAYAVGCASGGGTCSPLWTGLTGAPVDSSPAVANGVVYVGSTNGDAKLYAYATGCASGGGACTPLWTAATGAGIESSPAVSNGVVYVGSGDKDLYAYGLTYPAATYTPISPRRVLDSRPTGSGHTNIGLAGKFTAGTVRKFTVAGAEYVGGGSAAAIPTNAVAVTGNLTVVGETAPGVIDLGPTVTATGSTATLDFAKGDIRANNVTIGLAPDGSLEAVYRSSTAAATTDLIFDVTGYFVPGSGGATYHSLAPGRVLDTRPSGGGVTHIGGLSKLSNRTVKSFPVAGVKALGWSSALVPSSATGVTGNLTVTGATSAGFVSLGPTMTSSPSTSSVNVTAGSTVANGVSVALSFGRLAAVWDGTAGSSANVIFDVTGYFTAGSGGLSYYAIAPVRVLDSSKSIGLSGTFASGTARLFTIGGTGGVPTGAAGISGNLTVLNPSSAGWALVSPEIVATPTTSTLNVASGHSEANGFDVALGASGHVALEWAGTTGSSANIALDITGYWK